MRLRGVLFDLWETLIQDTPERSLPRRTWRTQAVCEVLARHGSEPDFDTVLAALDATTTSITVLHDSGRDLDSAGRARVFMDLLVEKGGSPAPESAARELEDIITSMPLDLAPTPAPHAVETVASLKSLGLGLALVCNAGFTTAPHLRAMLEHYELLPHFDTLVFSDELQLAKPDPRIFTHALDGLGMQAPDCAFVGDNPHTDIHGAINAGIFAVQVGSKARDGIIPHARIDALDELIPALRAHDWL